MAKLIKYSKLMSYILRHGIDQFSVKVDSNGFIEITDLLQIMKHIYPRTRLKDIYNVVSNIEPDKQRFQISNNLIRANYGHSIQTQIRYTPSSPPDQLFHGTSKTSISSIMQQGLLSAQRQYVHLVSQYELAEELGKRKGEVTVLTINTKQALQVGIQFYHVNTIFWLADHIPSEFIYNFNISQKEV